jgi:hypothetical protein
MDGIVEIEHRRNQQENGIIEMLISRSKFDAGDVVTFKLVNGDEIVAKVVEILGQDYVVERPCVVVPNQQGIGIIQAMFTANPGKSIDLSKNHIMMMAPTEDRMRDHYLQVTTGIQPVTKGSIIA